MCACVSLRLEHTGCATATLDVPGPVPVNSPSAMYLNAIAVLRQTTTDDIIGRERVASYEWVLSAMAPAAHSEFALAHHLVK